MTRAFLVGLSPPAPTGDARDVIWALLLIIAALVALIAPILFAFIRSLMRERDYLREALAESQAALVDALLTGKVVRAVFEQAKTEGPPTGGGTT
jgi:hypothetical protein